MVKKLLERAIEIEGLLRIIRDGNPLPETYTLLSQKAVELAEDAMLLEEKSQEARDKNQEARDKNQEVRVKGQEVGVTGDLPSEVPMIVMTESTLEKGERKVEPVRASAPTIVMTPELPAKAPEQSTDGKHEELSEAEEEDIDIIKGILSTVSDGNSFKSPESSYEDEDDIMLTIEEEEEQTAPSEPAPKKKEEAPIIRIEKKENNKEEKPEFQLKKEEAAKPTFKRQTKLKSAFSLNDRFLYARELFEGNMKMFDSTLDFIEGIEEYSIIEDYFYGELEWNPESVAVASFMEILRPHFRN
ncbi:MAG: hypothetical protein K2K75_13590 [Muribaculaceae bacterium]|nr:hypothetical protein [Muribaculaceae bacterium]